MGVYYHYINHSKREYFAISALGGAIKFSAIGHNLAARAFGLLIARPNPETHMGMYRICGRWCDDNVVLDGDDYNPEWDTITDTYRNIGPDLIPMLVEVDGFEPIAQAASSDDWFFMELSYLTISGQTPQLEAEMIRVFGEGYRSRYGMLCRENSWFNPQNLGLDST